MATTLPTILVVEDDPDTRRFMETWLEFEGYRVRVASNGREALQMIAREKPCVMVVDLMMPVMDGAEFRRRLQGMPEMARIPFVLVSGTRDAPRIARDLGIDDVLPKPCDAEHLLSIVAAHCQRALSRSGRSESDLESFEASFEEERRCAT
jgi:CheY-like chemotaxis protein